MRPLKQFYSPKLACFIIAATTFIIYLPSLKNGFVNWDDDIYVYGNQNIQSLDLAFLKWVVSAFVASNWHPLAMITHAFDYAIWGMDPWGHHLTNLIFHTLNTVLVFVLVYRLTAIFKLSECSKKGAFIAIVTSLLFGIHPLHVESVAWVSERKDVLCAFFYLACMISYISYVSSEQAGRLKLYFSTLIFFILAMLSKPMAVTLPVVLLILDFFPLNRFAKISGRKNTRLLLIEKVPFFTISILVSVVTVWAQKESGALKLFETVPFIVRICISVRAYIFYLVKMVLPFDLSPFYPNPFTVHPFHYEYLGSLILLFFVTLFVLRPSKNRKFLITIYMYYAVTIFPVIGLFQVGGQAAADRYTYLPSIGPFILFGAAICKLTDTCTKKSFYILTTFISITLAVFLGRLTYRQVHIWHDSATLWTHAIKLYPKLSYLAFTKRGEDHLKAGNHLKALKDFNSALAIYPGFIDAHYYRGHTYSLLKRYRPAIKDFNTVINIEPRYPNIYNSRGAVYGSLGSYQQAINNFIAALDVRPEDVNALNSLGLTYSILGNTQKAIMYYEKAASLGSEHAKNILLKNNGINAGM